MKKILLTFISMVVNLCIFAQLPPNDPAYELVFSDEFSGNVLDSTKWLRKYPWYQAANADSFCHHADTLFPIAAVKVKDSNGNLDTTNCFINNGTLKLITRKENYLGEVWNWPDCINNSDSICNGDHQCLTGACWHIDTLMFNYTTAMLYSKFEFRYGYFEIKFRLPPIPSIPKTYRGHGGSFWLYSGAYNYWSEIDVFEINANNNYCYSRGTRYWADGNNLQTKHDDGGWPSQSNNCDFSPNTWHTAAVNWTSSGMEFYYDGILKWISNNYPDSLSQMPIIINCGGNVVPVQNYCTPFDESGADSTQFPYKLEIDYVRVYQPKKDCNTDVSLSSFNPVTYSNMLHKSLTMGTNVLVTNQSDQSFWASDYVLINDETTIDNLSNILINVNNCSNIIFNRVIPASARANEYITPPPPSFLEK